MPRNRRRDLDARLAPYGGERKEPVVDLAGAERDADDAKLLDLAQAERDAESARAARRDRLARMAAAQRTGLPTKEYEARPPRRV
jgi:hypothetical protein